MKFNQFKVWMAGVVGAATAILPTAAPGSLEFKVCLGIIGAGAAWGIVSSGLRRDTQK